MPRGGYLRRSSEPVTGPFPPTGPAGGDLAGTYPNPTVDGFQGRPVDPGAPAVGDVYVWNGALWIPAPPATAVFGAVLSWGADQISSTTTTRFLWPWYDDSIAPTSPVQWRSPRSGTVRNMRVRQNMPAGNGNPIVYTLRVEDAASALIVSIASTANDASNLVDSVAILAGDRLDLQVTKAASVGGSPTDIIVTMEIGA